MRNRIRKGAIVNMLTSSRIVLSLIMLVMSVFSTGFYACYLLAGITDMLDGAIARKLDTESEFGEKLDTIADIIFAAVALYKLLPVYKISKIMWYLDTCSGDRGAL